MKNELGRNTAGLKIITKTVTADLIKLLKKYRKDSISAIKSDILSENYVFTCSFSGDSENFEKMVTLFDELSSLGYTVQLFDEDHESSITYFRNWLETTKSNSAYVDETDVD